MKRMFCDLCHKEMASMEDSEMEIPYELVEFDLCSECTEEVSY